MLVARHRALLASVPLLAATLTVAAPAYAIPVTWDFTARISEVSGVPGVAVGDLVIGSISFESDTPPIYGGDSAIFAAYSPVGNMSFSVGPVSMSSPLAFIGITNHFCAEFCLDSFGVTTNAPSDFSLTGGADLVTSTDLPTVPPDLAYAGQKDFTASLSTDSGLRGTIETLTLRAPEPVSPLLIAMMLGAVAFARRSISTAAHRVACCAPPN